MPPTRRCQYAATVSCRPSTRRATAAAGVTPRPALLSACLHSQPRGSGGGCARVCGASMPSCPNSKGSRAANHDSSGVLSSRYSAPMARRASRAPSKPPPISTSARWHDTGPAASRCSPRGGCNTFAMACRSLSGRASSSRGRCCQPSTAASRSSSPNASTANSRPPAAGSPARRRHSASARADAATTTSGTASSTALTAWARSTRRDQQREAARGRSARLVDESTSERESRTEVVVDRFVRLDHASEHALHGLILDIADGQRTDRHRLAGG